MELQLLDFVSQFVELNNEEVKEFASLIYTKKLKKWEFLLEKGMVAEEIVFIRKGVLRQYYSLGENEWTFEIEAESGIVTNQYSYLLQCPSLDNIQALEETFLEVIRVEELKKLYDKYHKFEKLGRLLSEQLHFRASMRNRSLISDSALTRYQKLKKQRPEIFERVPQYHIASYLGITPQSLSRLRKAV
ncbi:cAMP-binding domain of CRP or a regulatory subunit of cAMP-dependent protein kinases [Pseudarcicella hirudinis]|uniref:cAMP-binding domain of CRP or a regulatory subunit of cAMP-dependent protein kinases n=1 Tax=Pseudarcicella hirudinis TaxID=1079859 RepID=A0A1I5W9D2_9BACT|nr:Crp/Fnr family transcriptional regulator [Pseudarcicella hirudinis]SFQ16289.1 cAMP-binding domain of CRP or a regulatory subunit of cAMP-dependent protein kinases [Pseudarcicella hirudinis]